MISGFYWYTADGWFNKAPGPDPRGNELGVTNLPSRDFVFQFKKFWEPFPACIAGVRRGNPAPTSRRYASATCPRPEVRVTAEAP
jgi:hypothetical protein